MDKPVLDFQMAREYRRHLETDRPEIWGALYPRRYNDVGGYTHPALIASILGGSVESFEMLGMKAPAVDRAMNPALTLMARKKMPTYWVQRALCAALLQTDYADEIRWLDMPLPHEAAIFTLPENLIVSPSGEPVLFLVFARLTKGSYVVVGHSAEGDNECVIDMADNGFLIAASAWCPKLGTPMWYHYTFAESTSGPTLRLAEVSWNTWVNDDFLAAPLVPGDDHFVSMLAGLAWRLILYMEAYPEEVSRSALVARRKAKNGATREYWCPNILGFRYVPMRAEGADHGSGHASPRLHWRRGHFRRQPFGPGLRERKTVWIQPVLVGAKAESG